ncbi:hypothetical protein J5N97_000961 [Dioscorea zingiberensis]|uniref:Uncharacterized protein n=1 Tax=Dioscorea zingiberensis TaxID=325984 RepID=A0A9D5BUX1_9LILI|nr:hypothetical protein J5N97_000961 [Dioscorea zingiberensis]
MSPSPFLRSPWTLASPAYPFPDDPAAGLLGSLVREEGHVYSLAASGELLYTGSDSKNIRVWKGRKEFSGFKSNSGLVKAIVVAGDRIFTGHQDGKIRVWRVSNKDATVHKRVGTLPSLKDWLKSSINPNSYVRVRRHRNTLWLRHYDAVSSLSLDKEHGLLYSGSWDKTFKVWRLSDLKCLESVTAHEDAINAVAVGPDGAFFTGSADGTVKLWQREMYGMGGGGTRHRLVRVLLSQEWAVTALAVAEGVVYAGSSDGVVNFWEWRRGRLEHGGALRGHRMAVLCLATAGRLVISGSADKTVCVWRRGDDGAHVKLALLTAHEGPVKCLAVEEDRSGGGDGEVSWVVYSGSLDRSVKVWRVTEKEPEHGGVHRTPLHMPNSPYVC